MRMHAQFERFKPLEEHPRIERAHARARRADEAEDVRAHQLLIAHHSAANAAPLTIEKFSGGMDHQVGAELEGLLQRRRAKAIVDGQQDAAFMRDGGDGANVGDD